MLGVIAFSALVGLWRGFTFELLSLAGWFLAYFAARWLQPWAAAELPIRVAGFYDDVLPLSPLDRLLGAGFGVLRAGIVLLVFATLIGYTPAVRSPAWRASAGAAILEAALQALLPLLPEGTVLPKGRAA